MSWLDIKAFGGIYKVGNWVSIKKSTKSGSLRFRGDDFAVFPREQGEDHGR